ncbi:MAG TPA: SRPBCC family protein [Devosia sp.]|nr:SRPBCC family protein [Devosia sp.]
MPKPLSITTPGDRQIVITRTFDAPRELVFLCYSRPELLRRWYGMPDWTMPVCEMDFRVGGRWRFVQRSPDGFEMGSQGIYTAIVEPERIEQTETYDDNWTQGGTVNVVAFTQEGGVTTSVTTLTFSSPQARAAAAASPMAEGMEIGFKRLDAVLAQEAV